MQSSINSISGIDFLNLKTLTDFIVSMRFITTILKLYLLPELECIVIHLEISP